MTAVSPEVGYESCEERTQGLWARREVVEVDTVIYERYCKGFEQLPEVFADEIHMCCKYDLPRRAEILLRNVTSPAWIVHFSKLPPGGLTSPLVFALDSRNYSVALALIGAAKQLGRHLVMMYPADAQGEIITPLHLAVASGRRDVVQAMMAILNQTDREKLMSVQATRVQFLKMAGHSNVLTLSLACGYKDIYYDLIGFGGRVDFVDPFSSATALHALVDYAQQCPTQAIEILGDYFDSNTVKLWWDEAQGGPQFGFRPEMDYDDARRYLLRIKNRDGYTALTYCAYKGTTDLLQYLLQYEGLYRFPVTRIGESRLDLYDLTDLDPIVSGTVNAGKPNILEHLVYHCSASHSPLMLLAPVHQLIEVKWRTIRPFFFLLALVHLAIMTSYTVTEIIIPILGNDTQTTASPTDSPDVVTAPSSDTFEHAAPEPASDWSSYSWAISQSPSFSFSSEMFSESSYHGPGASDSETSSYSWGASSDSSVSASSQMFSENYYDSFPTDLELDIPTEYVGIGVFVIPEENYTSGNVINLLFVGILSYFFFQLVDGVSSVMLLIRGRLLRAYTAYYKIPWAIIFKPDLFNFVAFMFCVFMIAALFDVALCYPPALIFGWYFMLFFTRAFPGTCYFTVMVNALLFDDMAKFTIVMIFIMLGFGTSLTKYLFEMQSETNPNFEPHTFMGTMILYLIGRGNAEFSFDSNIENVPVSTLVFVYIILATVLMLNLLIAAMSDTYGKVSGEHREALCWQMRLRSILVLEQRLPRRLIFWLMKTRLHYDQDRKLWMLPVYGRS